MKLSNFSKLILFLTLFVSVNSFAQEIVIDNPRYKSEVVRLQNNDSLGGNLLLNGLEGDLRIDLSAETSKFKIYNTLGNVAAELQGKYLGVGNLYLNSVGGKRKVAISANEGLNDGGGLMQISNREGNETIRLDSDYNDYSAALFLRNSVENRDGIRMVAKKSAFKGAAIAMSDAYGGTTVFLDAQTNENNAAELKFRDLIGFDRLLLSSALENNDSHVGSGLQLVNDISSVITVEIDGADGNNSGGIKLFNDQGVETIRLKGKEGSGDTGAIVLYDENQNEAMIIEADYAGNSRITVDEVAIKGGSDLSEMFDVVDGSPIKPGYLMSIDTEHEGKLTMTNHPYDRLVAGVISGANKIKPGMLMGQSGSIADGDIPIALVGRVYVYCNNSNGKIKPGDLLTSSGRPGYAMKATSTAKAVGTTIGKAMTKLDGEEGLVLVLINLQ